MDTYCINHISNLTSQKNGFGVSIVIERIKPKLKPISHDLSPYAALTRP